jgi:DNA polymerase-4
MIALADMNAFFAAVEQLDRPEWRKRPLGVTNGLTGTTIITCSYEARSHGIHTGMRVKEARKRCADFIQVPARPYRYAKVSTAIMSALETVTPDMEIFSVDEAFLDLTPCLKLYGCDAEAIGRRIKQTVFEASSLLCSVGIGIDKTVAKWAAKQQKPDGLTIVDPWKTAETLYAVPVTELCGINKGIGTFLAQFGVHTCGDMKKIPINVLAKRFGNPGRRIWLMAQGKDPEELQRSVAAPKSLGHGKVVPPNTTSRRSLDVFMMHMSEKVGRRLRQNNLEAQHYGIGVRILDGWLSDKYRTLLPTSDGGQIYQLTQFFLNNVWHNEGVFQVHVGALDPRAQSSQLDMFDRADDQRTNLHRVIDSINERFGEFTICNAPLLNRSDMPNVIAPSWKPEGHRNTLRD